MRSFCVIVPAHNEELMIERTLRGLMAAGAPPEDIYLVDDCSKDATGEIARSLGVNVLRNDPNLGKALAIQRIAEEYRLSQAYEFIALMDADTLVDPSYFSEMLKSFESPEVVIVCGRPISVAYNWLTAYRALCYANGHFVYRKAQGRVGMICIAPGCSTMYRSSIFDKLDWMNGTSAEDMYVTIQAYHERLGKIAYAGEAKVYTQTPNTLLGYCKQMFRWYGGTWQVIQKQRVYFRNQLVDWECKLLWTEGFLMAFLRLALPLVALVLPFFVRSPIEMPWYLASALSLVGLVVGSFVMSLPAVCVFAWLERRWDIVRYAPLYQIVWYVDVSFFLMAFWWVIVRRKPVIWRSPARYVETKEA